MTVTAGREPITADDQNWHALVERLDRGRARTLGSNAPAAPAPSMPGAHINANADDAMPTIDLTDDELAAVTAAIRRAVEGDRFPRALRLDPLRSALAKLDPAAATAPSPKRRPTDKAPGGGKR